MLPLGGSGQSEEAGLATRGRRTGRPSDASLLFILAVHDALLAVKERKLPGEELFAFLDDGYILCAPERCRFLYDLLADRLFRGAGIQVHTEKTRVWNQAGECPPDMQVLGPEVWSPEGVKILGTPVGHADFIQVSVNAMLEEEDKLWRALSWVPDLQCAWQLLVQCAGPLCHHLLRTMAPSHVVGYAAGHDEGMRRAMVSLLGQLPGDREQKSAAQSIATLPMRLGGLGLRSATDEPCCILGFVGRCFAHVASSPPSGHRQHRWRFGA